MMRESLIHLPQEPGTVIAIGEWWLVRLRESETGVRAWELLPFPTRELTDKAGRLGVKTQCVYSDEWVLAEVEAEGGYDVIALPGLRWGVRYTRGADESDAR